ncbi:DNA repair protein RecO [Spiroplasma endosymbiont of Panorpa germanica]|uniref:DNA repair protein RecO n=1 Tax=Spiroplasma endosymbiont of Panorpa germanica TaxID=3066314 RepID=UPI0030CCBE77
MAAISVEGIVLKSYEFNDFDKVVSIFTKEFGRLQMKAFGVNKMTSKNRFSIQTFSHSNFQIFKTNNPDKMSKLKTGELVDLNINLSKNYQNYLYASACAEIIELSFDNYIKNVQAFEMLREVIFKFSENVKATWLFALFLFYSLDWFGVKWNLKKCINCHNSSIKYINFDCENFGFLCPKCNDPEKYQVGDSFINLLAKLDINNFMKIKEENDFLIRDIILLINILIEYLLNSLGLFSVSLEIIKKQKVFQNALFL